MTFSKSLSLLALALVLTDCGSGGGGGSSAATNPDAGGITYSGATQAASITAENQEEMSSTSSKAIYQNLAGTEITIASASPMAASGDLEELETVARIIQGYGPHNLSKATTTVSAEFCSSGSALLNEQSETAFTLTFSDCALLDTLLIVDGVAEFSTNAEQTVFSIVFKDFRITDTSTNESFFYTMSITCDELSCTISSDYLGEDGKVYRVTDFSITTSGDLVYAQGRFYHPDHGYVTFSADSLLYGCEDPSIPQSGSMTLEAANTTVNISFDGCTGYTVTREGLGSTYSW